MATTAEKDRAERYVSEINGMYVSLPCLHVDDTYFFTQRSLSLHVFNNVLQPEADPYHMFNIDELLSTLIKIVLPGEQERYRSNSLP